MLLDYHSLGYLPSSEELPDSEDPPTDHQLQHLIPTLLEAILALIWAERQDWYFGADMGIYYNGKEPPIVPDGFLSLGVQRFIDEELRSCYVMWEEQKAPTLVLEVVSKIYCGEYNTKNKIYAKLGVLYYAIYNPCRRKSQFELYRLEQGKYILISGNPIWLPEINLGLGREIGTYQGITREWLYWYDEQGQKFLTPEERIQEEQKLRLEAEQKAEILAQKLRELGIDPETLA